jgi:hypothetical protein
MATVIRPSVAFESINCQHGLSHYPPYGSGACPSIGALGCQCDFDTNYFFIDRGLARAALLQTNAPFARVLVAAAAGDGFLWLVRQALGACGCAFTRLKHLRN